MHENSKFCGMHAVSVIGAGVENGESFMLVKSSHGVKVGNRGYLKVSIDVLIIRTSQKCQEIEKHHFQTPTPLLTKFCFPLLLEEEEENTKKTKIMEQIKNMEQRSVFSNNLTICLIFEDHLICIT